MFEVLLKNVYSLLEVLPAFECILKVSLMKSEGDILSKYSKGARKVFLKNVASILKIFLKYS